MVKRFLLMFLTLCAPLPALPQTVIRVGAFPNITHAQAMVGKANGWFEKAMGPNVKMSRRRSTPGRQRSKRCSPARLTWRTLVRTQPSVDTCARRVKRYASLRAQPVEGRSGGS